MSKVIWKPGTFIYPIPAVMVSCGDMGKSNIITVAWTGILNTNPARVYVSIRPERYSYNLIKEQGEFVINLTTEDLAYATDWCGVRSGRDYNKFEQMGIAISEAKVVSAPVVELSPISIECRVRQIIPLGSHDMFLADVVNVLVDEDYIDPQTGKFDLRRANPIAYSHGEYFSLGELVGHFGWSVRKKPKPGSAKRKK